MRRTCLGVSEGRVASCGKAGHDANGTIGLRIADHGSGGGSPTQAKRPQMHEVAMAWRPQSPMLRQPVPLQMALIQGAADAGASASCNGQTPHNLGQTTTDHIGAWQERCGVGERRPHAAPDGRRRRTHGRNPGDITRPPDDQPAMRAERGTPACACAQQSPRRQSSRSCAITCPSACVAAMKHGTHPPGVAARTNAPCWSRAATCKTSQHYR